MNVDLLMLSCSRPDLFCQTIDSFNSMVKFSGNIRKILHEDIANEKLSNKVLDYAKGKFDIILFDKPPLGQGVSLDKLVNMAKTEYFLSWEDDWEIRQEIDIDRCIELMNKFPQINQIVFHKRKIMGNRYDFIKKEVNFEGNILTTNPHWGFQPGIWRKSFIMKYWKQFPNHIHWRINDQIKGANKSRDAEWIIKNVGCYFWGHIGSGHMMNHLGRGRQARDNSDKGGK
jgi:hypothetical protein